MAQGRKRLDLMRANPTSGWTISDIENVCGSFDIECNAPKGGGSHYKIAHRSQFEILTIPARRPIKPVYIRQFVRFVEAVIGADDGNS